MKKIYVSPEVEQMILGQNLSFLEYFSGVGNIDQFEDGDELEGIIED